MSLTPENNIKNVTLRSAKNCVEHQLFIFKKRGKFCLSNCLSNAKRLCVSNEYVKVCESLIEGMMFQSLQPLILLSLFPFILPSPFLCYILALFIAHLSNFNVRLSVCAS